MYGSRRTSSANRLVLTGLLSSLALVLELFVHIPMFAEYLLYSPGDIPVILASFALGPAAGVTAALVKEALFVVLTGKGGPLGGLMHFVASGGMVFVLGLLARRRASPWALEAAAVLTRVGLMVPMNLLITPLYTGLPVSVIARTIVPVVIPFNTVHAGINTAACIALVHLTPLRMWVEDRRTDSSRGTGARCELARSRTEETGQ